MQFETGKTYRIKFIGDSELETPATVVKRTAKTVWLDIQGETGIVRKKIKQYEDGTEYCEPYGTYSMRPYLSAAKPVQEAPETPEEPDGTQEAPEGTEGTPVATAASEEASEQEEERFYLLTITESTSVSSNIHSPRGSQARNRAISSAVYGSLPSLLSKLMTQWIGKYTPITGELSALTPGAFKVYTPYGSTNIFYKVTRLAPAGTVNAGLLSEDEHSLLQLIIESFSQGNCCVVDMVDGPYSMPTLANLKGRGLVKYTEVGFGMYDIELAAGL
jgi:hypothetical protein